MGAKVHWGDCQEGREMHLLRVASRVVGYPQRYGGELSQVLGMLRLREGGVEVVAAVRLEAAAGRMLMRRRVHQLSHSGEEILRDAEERVDGSCCWV
jgi:hypothetical protein